MVVSLQSSKQMTVPSNAGPSHKPIRNPYASATRTCASIGSSSSSKKEPENQGSIDSFYSSVVNTEKPTSDADARNSQTAKSTNNGNTEYWQRLPSQNLSFGSAEILTVNECLAHSAMYKDRSIRTTGVLHQRYFQGELSAVVLELVHPPGNHDTRNGGNIRNIVKTTIGKSGKRPPLLQGARPNSLLRRKRKAPGLEKDPPQIALKVVLGMSMPQLDELTIGSMVMIIGTMLQNGKLQARIAQKVDNFDMTFFTNGLIARRKYIYKRRRQANQASSTSQPIQGCGPPPYNDV